MEVWESFLMEGSRGDEVQFVFSGMLGAECIRH
jgi:hypothetical protein